MSLHRATNADHLRPIRRRGAAAVELALVSPLIAVLFLGMTELSRVAMVKVAVNNAARKGCQTGILAGKGNQDISSDVIDVMSDCGFTATHFNPPTIGSITITIIDPNGNTVADALTAPADSMVSVQVSIPVSSTAWVTSYFATGSQKETVVMKKQ